MLNRRKSSVAILSAVSALSLAGVASAQTGPALLLKPFEENKPYELSASASYFFPADAIDIGGDDADVQVTAIHSQGRLKLDLDGAIPGINKAQPRAGYDLKQLLLQVDGGTYLPDSFTDLSFGFGMGIAAGEKYKAGITVGFGYAGANPFGDGDALYGKADLAVGFDIDERSTFGFVLNYDGNRSFLPDVPLPGFQYQYRVSDQISVAVGFPFSNVVWTPDDHWRIELTYSFPDSATGKVEYKVTEQFGLYAELSSETYSFHWDALDRGQDRVFFDQTRVEVGLSGYFNEDVRFTLAGGYAFGQSFEQGWDTRDTEVITDLEDAPYVRFEVEARF